MTLLRATLSARHPTDAISLIMFVVQWDIVPRGIAAAPTSLTRLKLHETGYLDRRTAVNQIR